ncbi:MAG: hypothetical protein JXQ76_10130, partial [Campylobacterales bacterium]|nr:hypothetical protein [Campylobacterales bacterium]
MRYIWLLSAVSTLSMAAINGATYSKIEYDDKGDKKVITKEINATKGATIISDDLMRQLQTLNDDDTLEVEIHLDTMIEEEILNVSVT